MSQAARLRNHLFAPAPEYHLASWLFLRCIALIYLIAFLSLGSQVIGLVGEHGILPTDDYLQRVHAQLGNEAWLRLPTLFWLNHSDLALQGACYLGAALAVLLLFGRLQVLALLGMFALYLSLYRVGQVFLNFQWDSLLLEAGFLSIFLARGPNRLLVFLFHWLLFRLRFLSGISKIVSGDPSWANLTALNHYFETQPLPHIGAWYAHQLPHWLLKTGTGLTLLVEILVPFFIFLPRRFRITAALLTIGMQLMIIATSNHNWINLLTIALCLFLLDDRFLQRWLPESCFKRVSMPTRAVRPLLLGIAATALIATSIASGIAMAFGGGTPFALRYLTHLGLGSAYHIFPTMQTQRHELMIEGSNDGREWQRYHFRYKPDSADDAPRWNIPHQPRLDWMIWFVPPRSPTMRYWFEGFMYRLHQAEPSVLALLEHDPFKGRRPRYLRVLAYQYRFTDWAEHGKTGRYWRETYLGQFPRVRPRRPLLEASGAKPDADVSRNGKRLHEARLPFQGSLAPVATKL